MLLMQIYFLCSGELEIAVTIAVRCMCVCVRTSVSLCGRLSEPLPARILTISPCIIGLHRNLAKMFTMMRQYVTHKTQACTSNVNVPLRSQISK